MSSIAGRFGLPFTSLYNSSKFAVEGLTECLHYELSLFGIDIKTVAPGSFRTGFHDSVKFTESAKKEDFSLKFAGIGFPYNIPSPRFVVLFYDF